MKRQAKPNPIKRKLRSRLPSILGFLGFVGLGTYMLFGPNGLVAIGDHRTALAERQAEHERLEANRTALENRVRLLDPENVDPDFGGELIRKELGVAAPDEIVIPLD